jgi:transposase
MCKRRALAQLEPSDTNRPKKLKQYDPRHVVSAVEAVTKHGSTAHRAALEFGVPKSTLYDALARIKAENNTMTADKENIGMRKRILTDIQEHELVELIKYKQRQGESMSKPQVNYYVMTLLEEENVKHPSVETWLENGVPSRKWWQGFQQRHPELSWRVADRLEAARRNVLKEDFYSFYDIMAEQVKHITDSSGLVDPSRIYNLDESNVQLDMACTKVLVVKGSRHTHTSAGTNRDGVTVLFTIRADGHVFAPFVIAKG